MKPIHSIGKKLTAGASLWCACQVAFAGGYSIQMITKETVGDTHYSIYSLFAGNRYLNDNGQVVGVSRKDYQHGLYTEGDRAFIWQAGHLIGLPTLGTDANYYGFREPLKTPADSGNSS